MESASPGKSKPREGPKPSSSQPPAQLSQVPGQLYKQVATAGDSNR